VRGWSSYVNVEDVGYRVQLPGGSGHGLGRRSHTVDESLRDVGLGFEAQGLVVV